jgi:hypothetical protein
VKREVISDQSAQPAVAGDQMERALLHAKAFQQSLSVYSAEWAALVQRVREQTIYVRDERSGIWQVTNPIFPDVVGEGPTATMGWEDLLAKAGKEDA